MPIYSGEKTHYNFDSISLDLYGIVKVKDTAIVIAGTGTVDEPYILRLP